MDKKWFVVSMVDRSVHDNRVFRVGNKLLRSESRMELEEGHTGGVWAAAAAAIARSTQQSSDRRRIYLGERLH